jgi:hypothetical protein
MIPTTKRVTLSLPTLEDIYDVFLPLPTPLILSEIIQQSNPPPSSTFLSPLCWTIFDFVSLCTIFQMGFFSTLQPMEFFFRPLGREDEGKRGTCIRGEEKASKKRESLVATGKKI